MRLLQLFGLGSRRIIAQGCIVAGRVTDVRTCWWMKVNTRPVRTHAMDGAAFPHIITYRYTIGGTDYAGERFIGVYGRCPRAGDSIRVHYDPRRPSRSALQM